MALNEFLVNLSELVSILPSEVLDKFLVLVLVLKVLGIAAIIYMVYVIVIGILTYRRIKKVDHIEKKADAIGRKINAMDKKLDKLIKGKKG